MSQMAQGHKWQVVYVFYCSRLLKKHIFIAIIAQNIAKSKHFSTYSLRIKLHYNYSLSFLSDLATWRTLDGVYELKQVTIVCGRVSLDSRLHYTGIKIWE